MNEDIRDKAYGTLQGLGVRHTPRVGVPILDDQKKFSGRYSMQPDAPTDLDDTRREPVHNPAEDFLFASILGELELARFPMLQAIKKVMLGTQAMLNPNSTALGEGPIVIDEMLTRVQTMEARCKRTSRPRHEFFMKDLPDFRAGDDFSKKIALPSYTAGGIKYLFMRQDPKKVGFGVAINYQDYTSFEYDQYGYIKFPQDRPLGVRPFFAMPVEGLALAAEKNEKLLNDNGGYGYHVPTFAKIYVDFLTFCLQDHPAILAAHLLHRSNRSEAETLMREHEKLTSNITSRVLYFLGFEPRDTESSMRSLKRKDRDAAVLQRCGMSLFDAIIDWRYHCCKTLFMEGFGHTYNLLRIEKVSDLVSFADNRRTVPPPLSQ